MLMIRHFGRYIAVFAASLVMTAGVVWAADPSPEKEKELIGILSSEAPGAEKAIACKQLAIHGSDAAVPELAKLLPNPQLSSWARIALEAIPGSAADDALRKATSSLEGNLLVGTLNSIGVRRDTGAVELLTARIKDENAEVGSAAAVALGRIGNTGAATALRAALAIENAKVRSAVAEGCVLCAERILAGGNAGEAAAIYDEVRKADVPKQRILEATRGAILAKQGDGLALLLEQFQSSDKGLLYIGLSTAREFPGTEIDKALAAELGKAQPDRAALIIHAMADRKETVVLPAVLKAAVSGPKPVRLAAVNALGRVGDASCLAELLTIVTEDDAELTQAAKGALAELRGEKVDAEIVARLGKPGGKIYPLLIELVGQRRIEATAPLLNALDQSDKTIRAAALTALGETVALDGLPVLISQATNPKHAEDAGVAQLALKTASVRMPDRDACAEVLATALDRSPAATKSILLEILGEVGGTKALKTVGAAAKSADATLQDVGSRLLGKWNSVEAAPVLFDLAKTAPREQYQVRALRGYIGLARKFAMPEEQRVEMCQKAFDAARQPAEQKLVLDVLKLHPSVEGLKLAIKALQVPELKTDANQVTLTIAQKLGKSPEVGDLISKIGLDKVKVEIVKAEFGAGANQKDVTALLKKHAGDLPIITLPSESYNAAFGGDPAPNAKKQLKVQYKINGKAGEASFAEDALIILPMPK